MRTLLLVTGLARCTWVVGAGQAGEPTKRFNPLEATYTLEHETITLVNGKAVSNAEPGSATRTTTRIIGRPANGDVNGDGVADAAIVLIRDASRPQAQRTFERKADHRGDQALCAAGT